MRQHVKDARRSLLRRPGFVTAVVLTLGLGIGANGAMFGLVYEVVLRAPAFPDPHELVVLRETNLDRGSSDDDVTPANFEDWRRSATGFDGLAAIVETTMSSTGHGEPARLNVVRVSASLFPLLGVDAATGRIFSEDEDLDGAPNVVLVTHGYWRRVLGGSEDVVGRSVRLDDQPYEIVGVLPPSLRFPSRDADVFVPLAMPDGERNARTSHYLDVVGRLRGDVSLSAAQEELDLIARRLAEQHPESNADNGVRLISLHDRLSAQSRTPLLVLSGALLALLLLVIVNVSNLLLAQSASRVPEIAVRSALGASRSRILGQLMTEASMLGLAGAAAGLLVSTYVQPVVRSLAPAHARLETPWHDPVTLAAMAALAFMATLGVGLVPGLLLSRIGSANSPRQAAPGARISAMTAGTRRVLVVGEVALALALLVVGGLMLQSFQRLVQRSPGFRPEHVLTLRIEPSGARYQTHARKIAFYDDVLARVTRRPSVVSAGFVTMLPLTFRGGSTLFELDPPPPDDGLEPIAVFRSVRGDYFRALGIPLLLGRAFEPGDDGDAPRVAVVNQTLARTFFADDAALGGRLALWGESTEIVGVVGDVRQTDFGGEPRPAIYVSASQRSYGFFDPRDLAIRVSGDPVALATTVRDEIWAVDPDLPIASIQTMDDIVASSVASERLRATLLSLFGVVALALAAIGIYGVVSYLVAQRRGEIGLRMALGATRRRVVGTVTADGMALAVSGTLLGLPLAYAAARVASGALPGVEPGEPWAFVAIAGVLLSVALLACLVPALRASRIDPIVAIRREG